MKSDIETQALVVKAVIASQLLIESLDELEKRDIYRKDLKFYGNKMAKALEDYLTSVYKHIDNNKENEETFMRIERAVREVSDKTLRELFIDGGGKE